MPTLRHLKGRSWPVFGRPWLGRRPFVATAARTRCSWSTRRGGGLEVGEVRGEGRGEADFGGGG